MAWLAIVLAAGVVAATGVAISQTMSGTAAVEGVVLNGGPPATMPINTATSFSVGISTNTLSADTPMHLNLRFFSLACSDIYLDERRTV
jgi:hypothetical protein